MRPLSYRATTSTGDVFDLEFPLHPNTEDATGISGLISEILSVIDRSIAAGGPRSNGDVLQAVAMAMSIRARMINAPTGVTGGLAQELLSTALAASAAAPRQRASSGRC